MKEKYDLGLIGLGLMGRNLIFHVAEQGLKVFGYDNNPGSVEHIQSASGLIPRLNATSSIQEFVLSIKKPRKIMMLVPAGKAVDSVIECITPLLEPGDLLMDGGNSYFRDTEAREARLAKKDIRFLGIGISGGAYGARTGPSIMPGGNKKAYDTVSGLLTAVAAKFGDEACVAYLGKQSAGHYTKMVHNGIEYGLMQLIAEAYGMMKNLGGFTNGQMRDLFSQWNAGRLQSYLIEITASILVKPDPLGSGALLDQILDKAKQKGTGKWTSQNAMDLGVAVPTIDTAVRMREISAFKTLRKQAEKSYKHSNQHPEVPKLGALLEASLYFGFLLTYAQGFHLLQEASREYNYALELSKVAKIWRSGCIIRAALLQDIADAHSSQPAPEHLLLAPGFEKKVRETLPQVREVVQLAARYGIPMPAFFQSLAYFDAFTNDDLPVNLIQAQRDYFGSHSYERRDRDGSFRTDW